MSYWVSLEAESGPPLSVSVTHNYSAVYADYGFSLRDLDGKRAADAIPTLSRLVDVLGTRQATDYWAATPGNAGHALNILLGWARANPDAVFRVS